MYQGDILYIIILSSWLIIRIVVLFINSRDKFENLKSDWEIFLGFWPKQQYLTYLSARDRLEMLFAINAWLWFLSCFYKYARDRYLGNILKNFICEISI